jgi:ACS family tartrate transporter-like MFS transporter
MVLVGRRSDRTGERHLHLAVPAVVGAVGFLAVTRGGATAPLVGALSLTAFGVVGWLGPFWSLPTAFLRKQAAAGGIALINSMGAVGGFVGPYLIGTIRERTGEFTPGLLVLAGFLVAAAVIVVGLRAARVRRADETTPCVSGRRRLRGGRLDPPRAGRLPRPSSHPRRRG